MTHFTDPSRAFGPAIALNGDSGAPEWVELIPAGPDILGRDGRKWVMRDPARIIAAFAANRAHLPIDWEHAQFERAPKGEEAPASGWIEQIEARNGALFGRVNWTLRGAAAIAAREYRYLSPVFTFDPATREICALKGAGLVNRPNLELPALNQEGSLTMWKQVLAALGLPETATEQDAVAAINALKTEKETAACAAKSPPTNLFMPRADYDHALNRAQVAEQKLADHVKAAREVEITSLVDAAVAAGQIAPATKEYHLAACRAAGGMEAFKAMVAKAPVVDPAKSSGLDDKKPDDKAALNAEELAICRQLGISEETYRKGRASA